MEKSDVSNQNNEENFEQLDVRLDKVQEEVLRHFYVISERLQSNISALGEGLPSSQERLEAHEVRLQNLEAS